MKQLDLGRLDGPVLIFGGPYSNLQATQALKEEARRLNIAPSHVICTGDVVAYCAQPAETIDEIRNFGCAVVAGNCENQLATFADNCGCGFEEGTTCDLLSAGWYAHATAHVAREAREWMAGLPDLIRFEHHGRVYAVIHGGATDVSRFVWECSDVEVFAQEIEYIQSLTAETSCVLSGHSGLPFQRRIGGVDWINCGVIGMPPHAGGQTTRYAVLERGTCEILELDYDCQMAAEAMQSAGLIQGYHTALLSGYWPSEDVLPDALRAKG